MLTRRHALAQQHSCLHHMSRGSREEGAEVRWALVMEHHTGNDGRSSSDFKDDMFMWITCGGCRSTRGCGSGASRGMTGRAPSPTLGRTCSPACHLDRPAPQPQGIQKGQAQQAPGDSRMASRAAFRGSRTTSPAAPGIQEWPAPQPFGDPERPAPQPRGFKNGQPRSLPGFRMTSPSTQGLFKEWGLAPETNGADVSFCINPYRRLAKAGGTTPEAVGGLNGIFLFSMLALRNLMHVYDVWHYCM